MNGAQLKGVSPFLIAVAFGASTLAEAPHGGRTKIEPALMEVMAAKDVADPIKIAVWLVPSRDASHLMRELREPRGRAEAQVLAEARALITETQTPVLNFLAAKAVQPWYASQYAPLIFAEPSKATILDLAKRRDVDAIYLSRDYVDLINNAAKSARGDVVWARGITGAGVKIAVVESGRIEFNNPYLANGTSHLPTAPISDHATGVAGIIVANDGTPSDRWKGMAWGAPALLSANSNGTSDALRVASTDWAVSNGARVVNFSVGKDTDRGLVAMDRYLDYIVRNFFRTIVVAAGNEGTGTGNVTSPGTAYNVVTTGSFYDENNFNWSDDGISNFSSFNDPRAKITNRLFNGNSTGLTATVLTDISFPPPPDPGFGPDNALVGKYLNPNTAHHTSFLITGNTRTTITVSDMHGWYELTSWAAVGDPYQVQEETSGDREKPEVVGVGEGSPTAGGGPGDDDIFTTAELRAAAGPADWIKNIGAGTSFAAPQVSGEAALIISRSDSMGGSLVSWPEAVKAIIMASACHEFEPGSLPGEKSGAGGIVACEADQIVRDQRYHHQFVTPSDFAGGDWTKDIPLMADRKTRVVLCWDANPVRNVMTGTSTGLTGTVLTDATANFGANNSKVGWILDPEASPDVVTGTSTGLTATVLTDTSANFGANSSKVGWILNPDTSQGTYFNVVGNTATTLTVTGDMTTVATSGDTYKLEPEDRSFSVVSNTGTTLTVSAGSDMTTVAEPNDDYRLVSYPTESLDADLDLRIWDPVGGVYLASSLRWENNYEIVEFTPPRTDTYQIQIEAFRFDGTIEPIGLAWTQEPCCSPDWGDAPDDMDLCPERPHKGDFPTRKVSNGADVHEFEVEWLSRDHTTTPGATWEMDAYVTPFELEKDEDGVNNINLPPICLADHDGADDGVFPDSIYLAGRRGQVTFYVDAATPNIGRYSDSTDPDEKLYVWGWFDWEHDDTTWDGNLMVKWIGGPSIVGQMPTGTCLEGCDLWDPNEHQKKVVAEFDVPEFEGEGPFWIRFRLSYGEPTKKGGVAEVDWTDKTVYGEVEDYISYQAQPIEVDYFDDTVIEFNLVTPEGPLAEPVVLRGPTTVHVHLDSLGDSYGTSGLQDVPTEVVDMELRGDSPVGEIIVRVRPDVTPSTGWIEENLNENQGILELPPFTATGSATSYFNMFFEIEVAGLTLHNEIGKEMWAEIYEKPPGKGDKYENAVVIDLYDENNVPTDYKLGVGYHIPRPQEGACCDSTTGICSDDEYEVDCRGDQQEWFKETPCDQIVCLQHTGACCDGTNGVCVDDALEVDCRGDQQEWFKDTPCDVIACVPHTGACCDGITGACMDEAYEVDCQGDQSTWHKDTPCDVVDCDAATGACCDNATGVCTDDVFLGDCQYAESVWYKDAPCSSVDCQAATGACCDEATGICTDGVSEAECQGGHSVWYGYAECSAVDCHRTIIPTTSIWGLAALTLLLLAVGKVYFGRGEFRKEPL